MNITDKSSCGSLVRAISALRILAPAVEGVRQNWRAMAFVWALAITIVVAYYRWPPVAEAARSLQALKASLGIWFAAIAGFIAGGLLPELAKWATRTLAKSENLLKETVFRGIVWSGLGMMVDTFYEFQARWFGTAIDPLTLVKKTSVDMLVFAPIVFVPYTVGAFVWRREGYRLSAMFTTWTPKGWWTEVLPTYVPNLCFWAIVLFAVYSMPTDLQYPMSALATACWSLIFTFINKK